MPFYFSLLARAAVAMQVAGEETRGEALNANPDFRSQNQAGLNSLRSETNTFASTAESRRATMENSWKSSFDNAVSAINSRLGDIARNINTAEGSYRNMESVNRQLLGADKVVSSTAKRALDTSGKAEQKLSKIEGKFQKNADKQEESWNSAESSQIGKYSQGIQKKQQAIHKAITGYAGVAGKVNTKSTSDAIKYDIKMNKMGKKYEDKFEGEAVDMDEEYAHFDDSLNENELYVEHLTDDTTSILNSFDPKKPGIDLKYAEAETQIGDALSDSADILEDWAKDNTDDFLYAQEDTDSMFADTASSLGEFGERYTKTIQDSAEKIQDALAKAGTANKDAANKLFRNVEEELQRSEVLATKLETQADQVEKLKDSLHEKLEAMVEVVVEDLQKVFEKNLDSFEKKGDSTFTTIEAETEAKRNQFDALIEQVKERFIADVQDTSNKASAGVDVVKTQIANAQASLGQVMDKMSKVAAEMQEQDKTAAIAPAKVSEIKVELGRVSEAKDIADSDLQTATKDQLQQSSDLQFNAEKKMGDAYGVVIKQIDDMKRKDEQAIDDTAGVAAGSLNDMLEKNLQSFSSLKADVTTADHSLMSAEEMLRKAQLALNAVPETFARIGAETINAFKDAAAKAEKDERDIQPVLENAMKQETTKALDRFDDVQKAIEFTQSDSAHRIDSQVTEVNNMLADGQSQRSDIRGAMANRKTTLESGLADREEEVELFQKKTIDEIAAHGVDYQSHNTTFKAQQQQSTQMFDGITGNTSTTGAALTSEFHKHVGEAFNEFTQAILDTSKHTNAAVLAAKKAVNEATQKDTIEFKAAVAHQITKLQGIQNEQAKLYQDMMSKAGGDSMAVADESFDTVTNNQKRLNDLMKQMTANADSLAKKTQQKIQAAVNSHDADRSNLQKSLNEELAALASARHEEQGKFEQRVQTVHEESIAKAEAASEAMRLLAGEMYTHERKAAEEAAIVSQQVEAAEKHTRDLYQKDMVQLETSANGDASSKDQEAMDLAAVATMTQRQSSAIDKQIERAEDAAHDSMNMLRPDKDIKLLAGEVNQLSTMFENENKHTRDLEDEAEDQARQVGDVAESNLNKGQTELAAMGPLIDKEADRRDKYMQELNDTQAARHLDISNMMTELIQLGTDMKVAMASKGNEMQSRIRNAENEVDSLHALVQYGSSDELGRIIDSLTVGVNQSADINDMLDDQVAPKTKELRKRVGQVYEDMGISLNVKAIDEMANQTLQEEASARQRLLGAKETLEKTLKEVGHETQNKLNSVFENTTMWIDKVSSMAHLSEHEKRSRIRAIKAQAARETAKVMAFARATIKRQMKDAHGIDEKESSIGTLLKRATLLAAGTFQTTSQDFIKQKIKKTGEQMEDVRAKYLNPWATGSLLQEKQNLANAQDEPWTPAAELRGDLLQTENLARNREEEDKKLEAQLDQMRAVPF